MKCHICDATMADPKYSPEHNDYAPCDTCMEVIEATLAGFTDKPAAAEDELGQYSLPYNLSDGIKPSRTLYQNRKGSYEEDY